MLPQWLVARVLVLGTLALAHLVVDRTHPATAGVAARVHEGLLGWDAGWYEAIARFGYHPLGHQALRFFPLFPLMGRALAALPGISDGTALVVIANLAALAGTALLRILVLRETGDARLANRSVWLMSLAPPNFVLVMAYAEGPLLVCTVGTFIAIRRGVVPSSPPGLPNPGSSGGGGPSPAPAVPSSPARPIWWVAVVLGIVAGLTRPLGVLLVFPVAVEAGRRWSRSTMKERIVASAAVVAPAAGAGIFLVWSWIAYGNPLLPVTVQTQAGHHGGLSDPFRTLLDDARGVLHHHFGTALHVPWVLLVAVLVVVCWRRLPASYAAFATAVVLVALSGTNLDSFERYALSAFPLVIAGALLTAEPRVERSVLALLAAGLVVYALLAFLNLSVP